MLAFFLIDTYISTLSHGLLFKVFLVFIFLIQMRSMHSILSFGNSSLALAKLSQLQVVMYFH